MAVLSVVRLWGTYIRTEKNQHEDQAYILSLLTLVLHSMLALHAYTLDLGQVTKSDLPTKQGLYVPKAMKRGHAKHAVQTAFCI